MLDATHARVRAFISLHGLIPTGSVGVVAASGGQDSCALLHLLAALRSELGISLVVGHFNHGFRGEASDGDARFVERFAASLGLPVRVAGASVPEMARRLHLSAQEAARLARHRFLDELAAEHGADWIALGHTRDDHVETVLMNILRGTGPDGLAGLPPRSGARIRPLLCLERGETAAYCDAAGIPYRTDASNADTHYLRNRVRTELLPQIATYYNLEFKEAVCRLSAIAAEEGAYLAACAERELEACCVPTLSGVRVERSALQSRPLAIRRRMMRALVARVRGQLTDVSLAAIDGVLEAAALGGPASFTLPGGHTRIEVDPQGVTVERVPDGMSPLPVERPLQVPGVTLVPELALRVTIATQASPGGTQGGLEIVVDATCVQGPLTLRTRRPGDRIAPLGLHGHKKLQDLFVDRKVPASERPYVPIITDQNGILWVAGHAVAQRVARGPETTDILRITIERQSGGS